MLSRRSFLGGLSAAIVGAPFAKSIRGTRAAAGAGSLALTVVNHTYRYANNQIYFYLVGTDLTTGRQAFVAQDGTLTAVSLSDNGPDGFADLSIPLAADGDTGFTVPANMSGRLYFSINDKVKFRVVTDGNGNPALQYPAGWVSSDPSYGVLHDWIEFTHNGGGMFCNTTMVDMFSIPLAIDLVGAANQSTGQLSPGGRDAIFASVSGNPDFGRLVVGNKLRVIAPGHGIDAGLFAPTYYDGYIDRVWSAYSSNTLTVHTGSATYTGQVSGGTLNFSGGVAPFRKPTTQDLFYCDGALSAPNDGRTGPVAAILGAAFNRSTLLANANQPATDPASFYQDPTTNHYAQAMHANSADGRAYGFPFDDVAGFASYVQDGAPTAITVSLTPF